MNMSRKIVYVLMIMWIAYPVSGQEKWKQVLDLSGGWSFFIGDNKKWADPQLDDRGWEKIRVPSKWEDHGFSGYDGYAWYRKSFDGTLLSGEGSSFSLFLGYIDDVDEVFLNGHRIGSSGSFPPRYHTAFNARRSYFIPQEFLNLKGRNVIAVRVYDAGIEGGIVSGDIGIYSNEQDKSMAVNLRGVWDFALQDRRFGNMPSQTGKRDLKRTPPEDAKWSRITVPGLWEHQGYHNFDGSAWYRKQFTVPKSLEGEDLVLVLGKIDDFDQAYVNGKLVGTTNQFDKLRIYYLNAGTVNAGALNILLVYVEDPQGVGGIYDGPIGLMKQSDFTRFMRWRK